MGREPEHRITVGRSHEDPVALGFDEGVKDEVIVHIDRWVQEDAIHGYRIYESDSRNYLGLNRAVAWVSCS